MRADPKRGRAFRRPDDAEGIDPTVLTEGEPQFVTATEVARRFRRTPRTLWNWEQRGVLVPVRTGRNRLYRLADVEALARSGWR
jgi:hypothetical protein